MAISSSVRRRCVNLAKHTGIIMRAFIGISFAAGVAFVVFACVVQFPVTSPVSVGMVLLGVYTMCSALVGACGSFHYRRCLLAFMVMQVRCGVAGFTPEPV